MLALLGLAIAIGTPVAWWATRPAASAGAPIVEPTPRAPHGAGSTSTGAPLPSGAASSSANPAVRSAELPAGSGVATAGPRRLRVPSLGVDAPIVATGVRSDGAMAIPDDVDDVGWYKFSPVPGSSSGTVVLAGHVDNAAQGKGALFNLRGVGVGARITLTLASGRSMTYRVTGRELFVKRRLPTEQLFTLDGAPRLVIITCGGPFVPALSSYRDNLVVAAEPIGS